MARKKSVKPKAEEPKIDLPPELASLLVNAENMGTTKRSWLWEGRIMEKRINLIQGWKGAGKSTLCAAIASTAINGYMYPFQDKRPKAGGTCLWLTTEEDVEEDVKPRWDANGGFMKDLWTFDPEKEKHLFPKLPGDVVTMSRMLKALNVRVLILDPLSSLANSECDLSKPQSARAYMEALKHLCDHAGITVILIQHLRKGKAGNAIEAGMNSIEIVNVARSVLRADKHPTNPDLFILSSVAVNGAKKPLPITYELFSEPGEAPSVGWKDVADISLEEILAGGADEGEKDEALDAKTLLLSLLKDGPKPAKDIIKAARDSGVGERTLRKAKASLNIGSNRVSVGGSGQGHHEWVITDQIPPEGIAVSLQPCSVADEIAVEPTKSK